MDIENAECSKLLSVKFLALAVCSTLRKSKYPLDIPAMLFLQHSYEIKVPPPPHSHFNNGDIWDRKKQRLSVRKDESGIAEVETQEFLASPYIQMFSFKRYFNRKRKNAAVSVNLNTMNFFISHPPL